MARIGKGLLMVNMDMNEALAAIHCVPDCKFPEDVQLLYGHRTMEQTEIYFISNQENKEVTVCPGNFVYNGSNRNYGMPLMEKFVLYRLIGRQKPEQSFH